MRRLSASVALLVAAGVCAEVRKAPPRTPAAGELAPASERVGPHPGGGFLLNSGWRLRPAGKQVPLSTLPMSAALSRDGKYLLVLNGGYLPPSISVLEAASGRELGRTPVADGWLGLTFSPKGDRVYVGGGSQAAVFEFAFANGVLTPARTFPVTPPEKRVWSDFIGDVTFDPAGRLLYAAELFHDSIAVINPQSGTVIERFKTGRRPYRILFHPDGKSFFVSSWTDGSVYHHQADNGSLLERIRLGAHPTDMVWRAGVPEAPEKPDWVARLFVAAANTNNVYVVGVTPAKELRHVETINVSMTPWQPAGMTPSALGLSPDGKRLYVVCSDANAVAVVDVSELVSQPLGFIPTGWYPTAVRALGDNRIVVLNGRGPGSFPNPLGPNPTKAPEWSSAGGRAHNYVARMQLGSASFIDPPDEAQLAAYTETVLENSPYRDALLEDAGTGPNSPIPARPGGPTPIRHVIYIVKENRTYDQVLGDLREGNGDPSLVLFGEQVTPNHHKLAREFVLLDNFYVNSDVSADGHNWSTAAIASDYVQKLWPNSYAKRRNRYDYEGQEPTATPPTGYLWTNAASAGVSTRNYGYFVTNRPLEAIADGVQVESVRDPVLNHVTNLRYRGFDLNYPDVERAKVFLADLAEFEQAGRMPQLIFVRLGNDHTSGTAPGKIAPRAAVADNDYALGLIVEAVSKSRFWPETAVFVLEDDAQNGPDHVDSHRSPALVISPWVRRGAVDHSMYNTTSMLRTMELILGLRPMTTFDAGARPMAAAFQSTSDARPYAAEKPRVALEERNPAVSPTSARSAQLDFSEADRIDDDELNDILWRALHGPAAAPPAPVRSLFSR
ncbi:MAG: bifunctional YncE family protein/alkaline phosphatase family protein [Bryobacteraceae bacterium]|jgi:DNA-binding beta-propeller fold protein YncE